jgi:hypothetical protein
MVVPSINADKAGLRNDIALDKETRYELILLLRDHG